MVRLVRVQPRDAGADLRALRWTFASRRAWLVALGGLVAYAVVYLLVAKAIVVDPSAHFAPLGALPLVLVPPDLTPRYLLSWLDPAFVLYLNDAVVVAPSVPVLATALVLGSLVGVNAAVAVESVVRRPPACEGGGAWWLAAVLPSFLASFSCCAPTILLLLGANFAVAVIAVVPFVIPVAALMLAFGLAWSLKRLERSVMLVA